jgi:Na+/proline symporter
MAGGLFTLFYIPTLVDGGASALFARAAEAGKTRWFNAEFSLALPFNIWMGVLGGTFVVLSSHGAEQLIVQRVLACRTVADGRKALILSAVVIFPLFLVFLLVGVMLWAYYQQTPMAIAIPEINPGSGIKANDYIYPIFMMTAVPHALKGFLIVAILSAAMSSVSSALTSLASVSTMDFVKPLTRKVRSETFYLKFSKGSTVVWAALLIVVASLSREVEYVLNAAFSLRGLTSGALLGGLLLVLLWRKGTALPVVVGIVTSFVVMIVLSRVEWMSVSASGEAVNVRLAWPWFTLTGTLVTLGVAWLTRAAVRWRGRQRRPDG